MTLSVAGFHLIVGHDDEDEDDAGGGQAEASCTTAQHSLDL